MKSDFTRFVLVSLGAICVLIGLLGLFLPFIQGILTIVLGIYLMTLASTSFKTWFEGHVIKYPKVHHHYKKGHEYMKGFFALFKK